MIYKIFLTENGAPKTGLNPTWNCLKTTGGVDKSAAAPAIAELGGGWYVFEVTHGVNPFDTPELVGVIDAGANLSNYERYVPVTISRRDLALSKLVNKAAYNLVTGVETIRNDADTANELTLTLSQTGNVETRTVM